MADETVHVKVGQEFSIPLKTIATAGYIWRIQSLPDALRSLETKKEKLGGETKPGDPTTQVFRFQVLEAGEHTMVFVLSRPWESQSMETHKVIVKAE
jgi:predicted secreted protein